MFRLLRECESIGRLIAQRGSRSDGAYLRRGEHSINVMTTAVPGVTVQYDRLKRFAADVDGARIWGHPFPLRSRCGRAGTPRR